MNLNLFPKKYLFQVEDHMVKIRPETKTKQRWHDQEMVEEVAEVVVME